MCAVEVLEDERAQERSSGCVNESRSRAGLCDVSDKGLCCETKPRADENERSDCVDNDTSVMQFCFGSA